MSTRPKEPLTREAIDKIEAASPTLKKLNDETMQKPRGFVIPKTRCVEIAGSEDEWHKLRPKWVECVLAVRGITVVYDHKTKGYKFSEVEPFLGERQAKLSRSFERRHREEAMRLAMIRDEDFATDHQRQLRVFLMNQHTDTAGKIESQREHARIVMQRPETMPRIG